MSHTAAADKFGLNDPLTKELSGVYLEGLDAKGDPLRHRQVVARARKRIEKEGGRPKWMLRHRKKEEAGSRASQYTWEGSSSVLAMLDTCTLGRELPMRGSGLHADPHLRLLHFEKELGAARLEEFSAKWKHQYKRYGVEFKQFKARKDKDTQSGDQHESQDEFFALLV